MLWQKTSTGTFKSRFLVLKPFTNQTFGDGADWTVTGGTNWVLIIPVMPAELLRKRASTGVLALQLFKE